MIISMRCISNHDLLKAMKTGEEYMVERKYVKDFFYSLKSF